MCIFSTKSRVGTVLLAVTLFTSAVTLTTNVTPAQAASLASNPIVAIVKQTSPAVVNIDVESRPRHSARQNPFFGPFENDPFFREFFGDMFRDNGNFHQRPVKGRGTGFIVTEDGQIITNHHVVDGADKITVTMSDGTTYTAKVMGKDPTFDIAVIKVEPKGKLPVLELGDSDEVEVGEYVVAIGNPYGFEHSVTAGVISAKNRSIHTRDVNFDGLLQTDAAINPGNSGGPLLDMDGRVVGINAAIVPYAQGMGFAVPINMAKEIMGDLVSYGRVKRGWLGVSVQKLLPEIAQVYGVKDEKGAIIADVFEDSAAEKGGVQRGDIVIKLNGQKVEDADWFVQHVRSLTPGKTVELGIIRDGKSMTLKVKLDERPEDPNNVATRSSKADNDGATDEVSEVLKKVGLDVRQINSTIRNQYRLSSKTTGLIVVNIESGSIAERSGIQRGDLLVQVNRRNVKTLADLDKSIDSNKPIVLMIKRDAQTFFVVLKPEEDTDTK